MLDLNLITLDEYNQTVMSRFHGLNTPAWYKKEAINFWLYKPQRLEDKAPVKTFTAAQNMLQ